MRAVRIIVAWPICWALFWTGHFVSRGPLIWLDDPKAELEDEPGPAFSAAFRTYQWTMGTSHRIQVWAEGKDERFCGWLPWGSPNQDETVN